MSSLPISVFCSQYTDCEAPISFIIRILSGDDPSRYRNVSNEFDRLGFTKVKDLASAPIGKAGLIKLPGNCQDPLALLYKAIEIYSNYIDKLIISAESEHDNQNFTKTQSICKELLTHKPNDLKVLLLNAESFFNCGNYDECINCLEKAINIYPNSCRVLNNLALVYMKKSEYGFAKQCLYKVCEINPFCHEAWTNYADFLLETDELISAEVIYARVLHLKPELYETRNKYGILLLQLNKIKEGKKQFKIAFSYAKDCPETLNNLADVYYKRNKFEKAIAKYEKLLEIKPDIMNACFMLGMAYMKCKKYQNAANAFLQASALEPGNVSVLKNLAVTYCLQNNMILSVETYKKCLVLLPENFDLNLELGLIYLHNVQNYQDAAICFKKCTEINPKRMDVYDYLFAAFRKANDYENASDTCMTMGDFYLKTDNLETARNAFYSAIIMNPSNAFGHWKLGVVFYKLGLLDLALARYMHSVFLNPDFADIYGDIGVIFDDRGLIEDARKYYGMALKLKTTNQLNPNLVDILEKMTLQEVKTENEKL